MHYKIIQLQDLHTKYAFMNYEYAKKHGFKFDDYKVVYEGNIVPNEDGPIATLEDLFYIFNVEHPSDFKGHSLSVSDMVELDGVCYYCDSTEWIAL